MQYPWRALLQAQDFLRVGGDVGVGVVYTVYLLFPPLSQGSNATRIPQDPDMRQDPLACASFSAGPGKRRR
eukprot:4093943-Pyramimonas_sp.AAC.1